MDEDDDLYSDFPKLKSVQKESFKTTAMKSILKKK